MSKITSPSTGVIASPESFFGAKQSSSDEEIVRFWLFFWIASSRKKTRDSQWRQWREMWFYSFIPLVYKLDNQVFYSNMNLDILTPPAVVIPASSTMSKNDKLSGGKLEPRFNVLPL